MKKNYVFYQWLDNLISTELNPLEGNLEQFSEARSQEIIQLLNEEKKKIILLVKQCEFASDNEKQSRLIVKKNYRYVISLINTVYEHKRNCPTPAANAYEALAYLLICLEEIKQFIELNFRNLLSPEERLSLPESFELRENVLAKLEILPDIFREGKNSEKVIDIVINALHHFVKRINDEDVITLREAQYHSGLLKSFESGNAPTMLPDCPTLHELLFYWNFNSPELIYYFTEGLENFLQERPELDAKLEFLHFHFKQLLHLPVMPGVIYDHRYPSVKSHFTTWIQNEIDYIELKKKSFTVLTEKPAAGKRRTIESKVMVELSSDQTGLILRAADELRVLKARSMSAVFEKIVPNLSTIGAEDPGWDNMRSSTYKAEERDKEIAKETLRRLIDKIDEY